jgi:voltage-gated potassium channel
MSKEKKTTIMLFYEIILVILAFLSVIFIWSDNEVILFLDKMVWGIFFLDVAVRLFLAKKKWKFIKENPFDIIAAIPLDSIFQTARIVRLFRVLRLLAISKNYLKTILSILKTNGLDRILGISLLLIFASAILVTHIEPNIQSYSDGIWWSIVTATTVGYGDISPDTISGRILAVILMLIGIGLIGMLTGSITTFFIKDKKEVNSTVSFICNQLENYDELSKEEVHQLIVLMFELEKQKENSAGDDDMLPTKKV